MVYTETKSSGSSTTFNYSIPNVGSYPYLILSGYCGSGGGVHSLNITSSAPLAQSGVIGSGNHTTFQAIIEPQTNDITLSIQCSVGSTLTVIIGIYGFAD